MDEAEIQRLRREITRIFGSSPHKKVWRELLDMYVEERRRRFWFAYAFGLAFALVRFTYGR